MIGQDNARLAAARRAVESGVNNAYADMVYAQDRIEAYEQMKQAFA